MKSFDEFLDDQLDEGLKEIWDAIVARNDKQVLRRIKEAVQGLGMDGAIVLARKLPHKKYKKLVAVLERNKDDIKEDLLLAKFTIELGIPLK